MGRWSFIIRGTQSNRMSPSQQERKQKESERCGMFGTWSTIAGFEDGRGGHGQGMCWPLGAGNDPRFTASKKTGTLTLQSQEILPTTWMSRKHFCPPACGKRCSTLDTLLLAWRDLCGHPTHAVVCMCVCVLVAHSCLTLWNPMHCSLQAPLFMGFSRQEYWSRLPCPSPGDRPKLGIELASPAWQAVSEPSEPPGKSSYPHCREIIHLCSLSHKFVTILSWQQ